MEDRKERNAPWLSVPQFGDWDQKGPLPDYSMDFSKIREMRKQNKRDPSRASLGNEEELIPSTTRDTNTARNDDHHHDYHQNNSPTARRSIFSYFNCCVKA
ncbi:uncharacterized protein LOC131021757 isoform X2 [Salvia miltiorrhiza]|uniref:uncharacterized protein LOC131021712 n=1 Tax=Salvia miltiorrhiza TaxID=226208 RepID=UPI0025AB9EA9|nr:uncharacterized protein LOC131021712 [Salvia miltiorrhiza]XP_057807023.1 uncharacterized protein LOC131021757 isoform X2 [Salvia miltiorrhiza]